jgi:hypothetical protein
VRSIALKYTLVLVIYVLLLSSCSLLTQSPFPPWIGLVQRQADVSGEMGYDPVGDYSVHVVDDGTDEYVFVIGDIPGKEKKVAVYDSNLRLRFSLTEPFSSGLFYGYSRPVADENGNVYLELLAFGPGLSRKADLASTYLNEFVNVTDGSVPSFVIYVLNGGATLQYQGFSPTPGNLGGGAPGSPPFDTAPEASYQSAYAATSHISNTVAFAAYDETNATIAGFLSAPSNFVNTNLLTPEVISSTGGFKFAIDVYANEISAATDAIIVRADRPEGEMLIAFDPSGAELGTVSIDTKNRPHFAMSLAHSHFYLFEPETEVIRRLRTWW